MRQTEINHVLDTLHLKEIEGLIRDLKYGSITIIVQDGKVIQIDKTEKHRMKA
ncbi:YezD family protein [Novisyntrophococcus fermenticellae]|mgnify:CR=1 FL=1|uniref:YezD family protein n=1 Tax=Novisyntrophococcus fermenticellae TaxID=2068655 RepID=UPI001E43A0FD|nr:YezD family protein [Novisyntrophococcus fermenticellae]